MKSSVLLFTAILACAPAFAQTNETTASALEAGDAANVSTVQASEVGTGTSKYQMDLSSENSTNMREQAELGSKAPFSSLNGIGLIYNFSKVWAFEAKQHFQFSTNRDQGSLAKDYKAGTAVTSWETGSTMLKAMLSTEFTVAGSKPLASDFRYYAPNDKAGREAKQLGRLRSDHSLSWDLNPRWNVGAWASLRTTLNSSENPKANKGSDVDAYKLIVGPSLTYSFSDKLQAYTGAYYYGAASEAQRGNWNPDAVNDFEPEVGMNWTVGAVVINPCIASDTAHTIEDGTANPFHANSRLFSSETNSYYLNVLSTF